MNNLTDYFTPEELGEIERILRAFGCTTASLLDYGDGAQFFFGLRPDEYSKLDVAAVAWELTVAIPGRKAQITDYAGGPAPRLKVF